MRVGVSHSFLNLPFKTNALFLGESLDESSTKLSSVITIAWKETLQNEIDQDIENGAAGNWLEKPRWLRGEIYHLPIDNLVKKFDSKAHYETDLYLGITKADKFLVDISFDEEFTDEAVIVLMTLDGHSQRDQEK